MGRMACTEPQCLYKGDLYLYLLPRNSLLGNVTGTGPLVELRKATVSFVMSVCTSGHPSSWNISAPTARIFIDPFKDEAQTALFKNPVRTAL